MAQPIDDFEFYESPGAFVRYLFSDVAIVGTVFEPCVGSGAILRASKSVFKQGTDLTCGREDEGRTWLTNDLDARWEADWHHDAANEHVWNQVSKNRPIDWTVSNTAFTPLIDIATLALKHSLVGVALLTRATIHEVTKAGIRRTWMAEHPPTGILWLPRFGFQRSKTTGKWSTDSACCCWVIWLKDQTRSDGHVIRPPQFINYAPGWVLDALKKETPAYRARMDALMETRQQTLSLG